MALNRYRETYNLLTYSKAFTETGQADNSKVNKNQWTPHNLRRICLDANGLLEVRYVTNNKQVKLVDYLPFLQQKHPELVMKEIINGNTTREQKGMIDALYTNLVFSNVEEIVFFTGNYQIQEELEFELDRLNKFIMNLTLIKKSFKRLHSIIYVEQPLREQDFINYKSNFTLEEYLKRAGVNYKKQSIVPLPEIDEYGVLKNFVLDSGEYRLDKPFNLTDDNKVKNSVECRLSKWYEWSKEKAKRDAEKQKEDNKAKKEEKIKEEVSKEIDKEKEYDGQLVNAVKSTLSKLETFYQPLWNDNYDGIFHEDGLRSVQEGRRYNNNFIIQKIYEAWKEVANVEGEVNKIDNISFNLSADYQPGFHRNVLRNKRDWGKIKNTLNKNYLELYEKYYVDNPSRINALEKKLTNCMVATKWSKNQVFLRFTGIEQSKKEEFIRVMDKKLKETYLASSQPGMISSCEINNLGVGTLTYIVNWKKFTDEILFAHKLYSSENVRPSLTNAVIGLKMDGNPLTINLIEANKILTSIIAGSGSGKGVMTMSLLASLFGAGASVVYLDYKPDIAGMLWDLEREYSSKGLKLLAVDVGKEKHETTGSTPIRTGELNLLPENERMYSQFKMLRMAKLFQLVTLIGKYRSDIEGIINQDISNLFFIIDELTSINTDFTKLELFVNKKETEYRGKASKVKATEEDRMLAEYYTKLKDIIEGMSIDFVQGVTKDWRMSGLKVILIGQQIGSNWKVDGKSLGTSFAGRLLAGTHKTISGVQQATNDNFSFTDAQEKLSKQRGVFSITNSTPAAVNGEASKATGIPVVKENRFTQFRSYFTLVKNDFDYGLYSTLKEQKGSIKGALERYVESKGGTGFVTQLISGFLGADETFLEGLLREIYDFDKQQNKEEVSFSGLLKVMQETSGISEQELIGNMSRGYNIMDSLFRSLPISEKYSHLEEYLCDCSPDSVFTLNELKGMLGLEGAVYTPKSNKKEEELDEEIDIFADIGSYDTEDSGKQDINKNDVNKQDTYNSNSVENNPKDSKDKVNSSFINDKVFENIQKEKPQNYRAYTEPLNIKEEDNPFIKYQGEGVVSSLNALREMTKLLMEDIKRVVGDYSYIKDFTITDKGSLVFNNILYTPQIEEKVINTLPLILRDKIKDGELVEFFNLREIYKFKNLERLTIESHSLAQGRARKELGIGYRKRFSVLFKKFRNLSYVNVGDIEYTRTTPDMLGEEEYMLSGGGFLNRLFGSREPKGLEKKVGKRTSFVDNILNSKPVKITTGALGWTVGTQVVYGAAMLMGPWGLLFGALAMAGVYSEAKKNGLIKGNVKK